MGTLTPNKLYQVPTVGGDAGPTFANEINATIGIMDQNMGGVNALSVAGNSNVTVSAVQAQALIQNFSGLLTGNITVFLPAVGSFYCIENATTGPYALYVGCTGGSNVLTVPQGLSVFVWTDGSAIRISNPPGWTEIATTIVNNVASVALALPGPFRRFRVTMQDVTPGLGVQLGAQFSFNGGTTTQSGYAENLSVVRGNATTAVLTPGSIGMALLTEDDSGTNAWDGTIDIYPGATNVQASLRGTSWGVTNAITPVDWSLMTFAATLATPGYVNAITMMLSSNGTGNSAAGAFSGTFIVEGLP